MQLERNDSLHVWRIGRKKLALKFKRTETQGERRVLPRDAVRGGSVYLPGGEQVHGHRSVESPAPGETQPATSLRHGPELRVGLSDTEPRRRRRRRRVCKQQTAPVCLCGVGGLASPWGEDAHVSAE